MYPSEEWVKETLSKIAYYLLYEEYGIDILSAFVVGSVARGTAREDSDLDIAVVISPLEGVTSLKFSEIFHASFCSCDEWPTYSGRMVDFQFFYPEDKEFGSYTKIELK